MKKTKLSVIIPVYNLENYIEKCLVSISQYMPQDGSVEVYVIDDGSKDNSSEIIRKFENEYLHYVYKENGGVSSARNLGLKLSQGEYVTFVDGDDYVSNDYFNVILSNLKDDTEMLCFDFYWVENDAASPSLLELKNETFLLKRHEAFYGFLDLTMYNKFLPSVWNKVFRLGYIIDNDVVFSTEKKVGEDEFFLIEYMEYISSVDIICDKLYYYIQRTSSVMHRYNSTKISDCNLFVRSYKELAKKFDIELDEVDLQLYYLHLWFGVISNESKSKNYKSGYRNIKKYLNHELLQKKISKKAFLKLDMKLKIYYVIIKIKVSRLFYSILYIRNMISG